VLDPCSASSSQPSTSGARAPARAGGARVPVINCSFLGPISWNVTPCQYLVGAVKGWYSVQISPKRRAMPVMCLEQPTSGQHVDRTCSLHGPALAGGARVHVRCCLQRATRSPHAGHHRQAVLVPLDCSERFGAGLLVLRHTGGRCQAWGGPALRAHHGGPARGSVLHGWRAPHSGAASAPLLCRCCCRQAAMRTDAQQRECAELTLHWGLLLPPQRAGCNEPQPGEWPLVGCGLVLEGSHCGAGLSLGKQRGLALKGRGLAT
jgi:hypothetical protein